MLVLGLFAGAAGPAYAAFAEATFGRAAPTFAWTSRRRAAARRRRRRSSVHQSARARAAAPTARPLHGGGLSA